MSQKNLNIESKNGSKIVKYVKLGNVISRLKAEMVRDSVFLKLNCAIWDKKYSQNHAPSFAKYLEKLKSEG